MGRTVGTCALNSDPKIRECSPVRTTVANAKSGDVTVRFYSSCQTCCKIVVIVGYSCSYEVVVINRLLSRR